MQVPQGRETILLVEDEPAVRRLISQMLQLAGYDVLEAASGSQALHLVGKSVQPVDLLLTDVVMASMSGGELARRLAAGYPAMRVLFTSGYMDDAVVKEVVAGGGQFLPKPFSPDALLLKVREVLDRPWYGLPFRDVGVLDGSHA